MCSAYPFDMYFGADGSRFYFVSAYAINSRRRIPIFCRIFGPKSRHINSQFSYSLSDIASAVKSFWQTAKNYRVLAFNGDMGAGKTTFIHALCEYLNVKDTVSSPTFALINEYHFTDAAGQDQLIFHLDLYRISSDEEALQAGVEDVLMNRNAYCFVEWAENVVNLMPRSYLDIYIEMTDAVTRNVWFRPVTR